MDHRTAGAAGDPVVALGKLALISTELNKRATLDEVTASVLQAALELNDASIAAVATLDGNGHVSVSSLARSQVQAATPAGGGTGDSEPDTDCTRAAPDPTHSAPDPHKAIREAVRRSDNVKIGDLSIGVISGCIESGQPYWYDEVPLDSVLGGASQALGHPVRDESGALVAVLGLGWDNDVSFSDEIRTVAEFFCDLTSSGLVRARRNEELSDLARQMRSALLPTTVTHDRLDVAFDYVPALNTIGFGGDWFDIVEPTPDRAVLVVGDIAGHGVRAAAQMALAQGAVRALSHGSAIQDIPLLASRSLTGSDSEMLATLGLIAVDLKDMTLTCQLAGHPPPMLRRPDASVVRLGGSPLPPIGMVDAAPEDPGETWPLVPGCTIVLYSDGLIERRGADLSERLDQLEATIGGLAEETSAADALETICTDMLTDESEDDVAILVVKVRDTAGFGAERSG